MKRIYKVEVESGTTKWLNEVGQLHRIEGPAIEYADGSKVWFLNGKLHREGGPAYEGANGSKWWYLNGERHREVGPSIEWANGSKEWYLNGVRVTPEVLLQYAVDSKNEKAVTELRWSLG